MQDFPYLAILKQAWQITVKNSWLWIFGLFIGGTSALNLGGLNFFLAPPDKDDLEKLRNLSFQAETWIRQNPELFTVFVAVFLSFSLILIIFQGLSKAAVIWATRELEEKRAINFKKSLLTARYYFWRIIGLQILITIVFLAGLIVFAGPIVYFFELGETLRGVLLTLAGLAVFIPASIVLGFLHLYGPIFIVLYDKKIEEALGLSLNLIKKKLKESIILSAFLIGLSFLFFLILAFCIVLMVLPLALFALLTSTLGFSSATYAIIAGSAVISFLSILILGAAFTVFQNITWILAVQEMIQTLRLKQTSEALAIEPAL